MSEFKMPKTLAACADRMFSLRNARLEMQKKVDEIEAEEKALKSHLINNLPKSDANGITGKLCRVTVVTKQVPQVKNWDEFYKYLAKTKSFEMLQKRLSDGAVTERWEAGKKVPGVEPFTVVTLSVNKV